MDDEIVLVGSKFEEIEHSDLTRGEGFWKGSRKIYITTQTEHNKFLERYYEESKGKKRKKEEQEKEEYENEDEEEDEIESMYSPITSPSK